jgi:hypothetical protein
VIEIARSEQWVAFEIASNMPEFMQQAASYGIEEIESLPVTLDEIFMSLYSDQSETPDQEAVGHKGENDA